MGGGEVTDNGVRHFNAEAVVTKLAGAGALSASVFVLHPAPTRAFEVFSITDPKRYGVVFVGDPVKP